MESESLMGHYICRQGRVSRLKPYEELPWSSAPQQLCWYDSFTVISPSCE